MDVATIILPFAVWITANWLDTLTNTFFSKPELTILDERVEGFSFGLNVITIKMLLNKHF